MKTTIKTIITVCTGNICRSPMAEGLLHTLLKNNNITIDSAATHAYHIDSAPDRRAIATMKKYGHNIANQKARLLKKEDLKAQSTLILVASDEHLRHAEKLKKQIQGQAKILKLLAFHPECPENDLPDPYYDDDKDFEKVYQLLNTALPILLKEVL